MAVRHIHVERYHIRLTSRQQPFEMCRIGQDLRLEANALRNSLHERRELEIVIARDRGCADRPGFDRLRPSGWGWAWAADGSQRCRDEQN